MYATDRRQTDVRYASSLNAPAPIKLCGIGGPGEGLLPSSALFLTSVCKVLAIGRVVRHYRGVTTVLKGKGAYTSYSLFVVKHHRRSAQVWHVFSRDLTILPAHQHVHPQSGNEPYMPLPSQPQPVLIYRPRRDGRLSRPW